MGRDRAERYLSRIQRLGCQFNHASTLPARQCLILLPLSIEDSDDPQAGRKFGVIDLVGQPGEPDQFRLGRLACLGQRGDQQPFDLRLLAFA